MPGVTCNGFNKHFVKVYIMLIGHPFILFHICYPFTVTIDSSLLGRLATRSSTTRATSV